MAALAYIILPAMRWRYLRNLTDVISPRLQLFCFIMQFSLAIILFIMIIETIIMIAMILIFLITDIILFALMCYPLTTVTNTLLLLLDDVVARGFYYPWLSWYFKITTGSFTLSRRKIMEFHICWTASMRKLSKRAYETSLGAHFAATVVAKITAADLDVMLLLWSVFRFLLGFDAAWYIRASVFGWMCDDCVCFWWLGILFLFLVDLAR